MGAEANTVASLLSKLNVDEPWVQPVPWESILSEGGGRAHCSLNSPSPPDFYNISNLSESSLVRLVMYALQGAESAVNAVYQISASFCSESADRSFHRNSSLWARSSSTQSLGNLLKSIGQFGCIVYLLQKFILHFNHLNSEGDSVPVKISEEDSKRGKKNPDDRSGVINQAFAVAVKKILESYISALNTLYASVGLRRVLKNCDLGCLTNVGNSEITVLEVYLHTKGLRTQIEALGYVCEICDIARSFSGSSLDDLNVAAELEFIKFPRGAALLTFLYMQLKVVDPLHSSLLKFLFLQSFEPYYQFVRTWIYEGRMSDPYEEFVMEYVDHMPGISVELLSTVRVREGVSLPCFLENFQSPLLRVGQQLQVLVKLLDMCFNIGGCRNAQEEILPFLDNPSRDYPFFASPLTFQKDAIESIVLARSNYYEKMLEKVDNMFTKVELRSPQASPYAIQHLFAPNHGKNWKRAHHILDDGMVPVVRNDTDNTMPDNIVGNDTCSTIDEFTDEEDMMVSSDSSSSNCFEEKNDAEQIPDDNMHFQPSYLSPLSISCPAESSVKTFSKNDLSYSEVNIASGICKQTQKPFQGEEAYHCAHHEGAEKVVNTSCLQYGGHAHTECSSDEYDLGLQLVHKADDVNIGNDNNTWFNMSTSGLDAGNRNFEDLNTSTFHFSDTLFSKYASSQIINTQRHQSEINCALSSSFYMQSCNAVRGSKFLSMNPSLSKACWINSDKKCMEKSSNYREVSSCFDFTSVRDPRKVCEGKLASSPRGQLGYEHPILTEAVSEAKTVASDEHCRWSCNDDNSAQEVSSDPKVFRGEETLFSHIAGGSKWESLLSRFGSHSHSTVGHHGTSSMAFFDVPLDYVIKKCLLEEILLQYQYVSKLTLKILEEGFHLQEHLLALRRFHFMELADWADLFIFSLWHHKWHLVELDKRIMEIQGALELSIQRSSCEGDNNKDRLYVYVKGDTLMPLSVSTSGICSFDFLGLGYRVDWPVSIILTPSALKIYSDVFNFLIQVKLAIFSLSDTWCLLKVLMQETRKGCPSECPKVKLQHISTLTETRHQVIHFVSTLQQYVQSHLSHVSWCKFLKSLKHKVKDMMDFEAVHMEYLTECVDICFLSEETQSIASIIRSMLKCSVELRSCLIGCTLDFGPNGSNSSELPQIDISMVLEIKKTFTKNVKDLFLIYLKSPKHGEFGLSRFWDLLDYNDYYGNDLDIQSHHVRWA